MNVSKKSRLAMGIVLAGVIGIIANIDQGIGFSAAEEMTGTQDVRSLDRRISLLEQRFYSIELSISRLQQSALSQRSPVPSPSARDQEINLIREEIHKLSLRLSEIECGLIKLDERTAGSVGDTRRSAGTKLVDPCRLNPATRLRLSNRP
jgi:hypothetical protein